MNCLRQRVAATFSQTLRAFSADPGRGAAFSIGGAALLLGAWALWFSRADVSEYETSHRARIEVSEAAHPIDAPVAGRVATARFTLGGQVHAGDVLLEIDAEAERRRLAEEQASLSAITPELDALKRTVDAEEQVLQADRLATRSEVAEGQAQQRAAELSAMLAASEAERATRLYDSGSLPELEAMRAETDAKKTHAAAEALSLGVARSEGDRWTRETKTRVAIDDLRREMVALEGRRTTTQASIELLTHEIDRRTIRAPIDGRIGDSSQHKVGSFVREGERLGAIVPAGDLRVVAEYEPQLALGRIHAGQTARVRLDGFPWTEYGTVAAIVTQVGSEPRDGQIRVELSVVPDPISRIPLEHGLPGSVEVLVEHTTPARLVFRAIGKKLIRGGG
jgi:membrane fusion protein (multidrug efflux system)